jgi:hypothetical protein
MPRRLAGARPVSHPPGTRTRFETEETDIDLTARCRADVRGGSPTHAPFTNPAMFTGLRGCRAAAPGMRQYLRMAAIEESKTGIA